METAIALLGRSWLKPYSSFRGHVGTDVHVGPRFLNLKKNEVPNSGCLEMEWDDWVGRMLADLDLQASIGEFWPRWFPILVSQSAMYCTWLYKLFIACHSSAEVPNFCRIDRHCCSGRPVAAPRFCWTSSAVSAPSVCVRPIAATRPWKPRSHGSWREQENRSGGAMRYWYCISSGHQPLEWKIVEQFKLNTVYLWMIFALKPPSIAHFRVLCLITSG